MTGCRSSAAVTGTGLSAKCEEAGGIDLIVIYNSGRYRMAGRGSLSGLLAYGNANDIVVEMAREILPVVTKTPVLAGVNGTDPFCMFEPFLRQLKDMGFAGIQNFPTVGLIDGTFRANLEETGMSYAQEVDCHPHGPRSGLADNPLRLLAGRRSGNGKGGRRHHRLSSRIDGPADRSGRKRPSSWSNARRWSTNGRKQHSRSTRTRSSFGARRTGVLTRGCSLCAQPNHELPRFLRSILDGAAADGNRADRTDKEIQSGDVLRPDGPNHRAKGGDICQAK